MMNVEERALEAIYLHGCHRDGWIGVETEQPTVREKFIAICLHEHGHPGTPNCQMRPRVLHNVKYDDDDQL